MKNERNAVRAGLFILISIALIVGVVIAIGGAPRWGEPLAHRVASFKLSDDLGGLRVGDDVRLGGYKIGTVDAIEPTDLATAEPHLLVKFDTPNKYVLRKDAIVGVQTTLTGMNCINILSLGSPAAGDANGPVPGQPDPKTVLVNNLGPVAKDLSGVLQDVRQQTIPRVNQTLDSVRNTGDAGTAMLKHIDGQIDPTLGRFSAVANKAGGVLDNLNDITGNVKVKLPILLDKVDGALDTARKTLADLQQQTAENTREISGSLRGLISDNHSKLELIIADLKTTGDNLKAASVEIRHSPWRLLYQPTPGELVNLNTFDTVRQFSDGANELNDAAQVLRDAARDPNADPKKLQQLLDHLDHSFKNFHEVEEKLWKSVEK